MLHVVFLPRRESEVFMVQKRAIRAICFALAICLLTAGFCLLLYHFDNKYTTRAEVSQDGRLMISSARTEEGTPSREITWLVDGWEFYPDQLIEPGEETGASVPVYIGRFSAFPPSTRTGLPMVWGPTA